MTERIKRTYNLSPETLKTVREMAGRYEAAPSQDAVIELAVDELARRLRESREADVWAAAGNDPEFMAEREALARAYRSADRETWPA